MSDKPWTSAKDRKSKLQSVGLWDMFVSMRKELKGQVQDHNNVADERIAKLYCEKANLDPEIFEQRVVKDSAIEAPEQKQYKKVKAIKLEGDPTKDDLLWAWANWDNKDLKPTDAPTMHAWAFKKQFVQDEPTRRSFAEKMTKISLGDADDTGHDPALDRSGLLETLRRRFCDLNGAARKVFERELSVVL